MVWRLWGVLGVGTVLLAGSFACSSADADGAATAGAAGTAVTARGGASNGGADANGDGAGGSVVGGNAAAGGAPATTTTCAAHPSALRAQGGVLSLVLTPTLAGQPFEFGQPNPLAEGGSLVPLNFRFYISQVELLPSSGGPVPVNLVTPTGDVEPYDVHLFNAEDDASATLRVLAPPGTYQGLSFALGIQLACNRQSPASMSEPLSDISQMTWPHTGGYLFLRYEGRYTAENGSTEARADVPPAVHMGGNITQELVPRVTVSGALTIPASGTLEERLIVDMSKIFAGATAKIDVSDVAVGLLSAPESIAGERLRRELPTLEAFVLAPPRSE